jgi:hypothetical protein
MSNGYAKLNLFGVLGFVDFQDHRVLCHAACMSLGALALPTRACTCRMHDLRRLVYNSACALLACLPVCLCVFARARNVCVPLCVSVHGSTSAALLMLPTSSWSPTSAALLAPATLVFWFQIPVRASN